MRKAFKKIAQLGYYGFFIVVFALGVLLLATLAPIPGNYEVKIVQSGSMEPNIPVGSVVFVQPADDYAVGDVVTYGPDTQTEVPTTHRITATSSENGQTVYTTKGDANDSPDPGPVSEDEIIGAVLFDIPYLGYVLDFARQPIGFVFLVGLPSLIVVIDELKVIYTEITKAKSKTDDEVEDTKS